MGWESLEWRPVGAEHPQGIAALAELLPMARSAADEAVSALVMGPITVVELSVADVAGQDLPDEFVPSVTFELLGTPRRGVWVALDPAFGTRLGGTDLAAAVLATTILDAFDAVLVEALGEGLSCQPAETLALAPAADLMLFRLVMRDPDGARAGLVVAVEAMVPVELATHVVALRALGPGTSSGPSSAPSSAAAGDAPVATTPGVAEPGAAAPPAVPAPRPQDPPAGPTVQAGPATSIRPYVLEPLPPAAAAATVQNIELLMGVQLEVTVEIGRTRLAIRDVLALAPGSIVELDKLAGEKVDVLVNGQPIAQGEVVVVDENFGVRITDVVSRQRRILSADGAA